MSESEEVVSEPVEAEHVSVEISDEIPTVVVGKKKKIAEPQALPEALPPAEQLEEPVEEKTKPKRASRARVSTKAPPPPEPVPEPVTPAPKKAVRMKKAAAAPIETALEPVEEPVSSKRLLNDLNEFSARTQELHRMNEQHRKNVYRELIGGMV
jgi:hypothetical protein